MNSIQSKMDAAITQVYPCQCIDPATHEIMLFLSSMYELLAQKFQLFEGVFGASDEMLGSIGWGINFERRIADIYQNCREPAEIKASFDQLQRNLSGEISEAMVKTRQIVTSTKK